MLEKDREEQLDRWCEEWSIRESHGWKEYPDNNIEKEC